jgi:hypothetical protein
MGTCGAAHDGGERYWVVVHNESTDHYICGPDRPSCASAREDVDFMSDWVGPRELERLTRNDVVTFHIDRWPEDFEHTGNWVWSWVWNKSGPPALPAD